MEEKEEEEKDYSTSEDEEDGEGALTIVAHEEPPRKRKGTPSPKSRKKMYVLRAAVHMGILKNSCIHGILMQSLRM